MRHAAILLTICLAAASHVQAQELDKGTLDKLKASTVFVIVDTPYGRGSGSGFLFIRRGAVGYIITCEHVVDEATSVSIVFNSGTKSERKFEGKVVATDPQRDLACVLIRNAKDLPNPLEIGLKTEATETQTVYAAGFPFGKMLSADDKNPEITISKATVSSLRRDNEGRMAAVQLSGDVNPGNSGGPLVDSKGRVIGVTQSKVSGTSTAFAVPPEEIQAFLRGRAKTIDTKIVSTTASAAKVDVTIGLADPLGTIKQVSIFWCPEKAIGGEPKPGKDGLWAKLHSSMKSQSLKIDEDKATGTIELARSGGDSDIVFLLQTSYVAGDGRTIFTEPVPVEIQFAETGAKPTDKPADKGANLEVADELKVQNTLRLRAAIGEMILAPDGATLYVLDLSEAKVYAVKTDTMEITAQVDVHETAVSMCLTPDGKTLYVGARDPNHDKKEGSIQTITTGGLKSAGTFNVAYPVHRLVATNAGIIVTSGTGSSLDGLAVIDGPKKTLSGTCRMIWGSSSIRLHPDQTRVYTGDNAISPGDFHCVLFTKKDKNNQYENYDSPYHGDYPMGGDLEISPDGKYLIGVSGTVLRLGKTKDADLKYVGKIDKGIALGVAKGSNTMFVSTLEGFVKVYQIDTLELQKSIKVGQWLTRIQLDPARKRLFAVTCAMPERATHFDPFAPKAGDVSCFSLSGK